MPRRIVEIYEGIQKFAEKPSPDLQLPSGAPITHYPGGMRLPPGDAQLVQIVDRNLAEAAARSGPHLACRIGCTQCCHGAFAINALDAGRLRVGMAQLRAEEPELAARIERRARAWIEEHGGDFPGDPATGLLGSSEEDQARLDEFASDAPCPALDPESGRCDVYPWRPMTCRIFGPPVRALGPHGEEVLGHCELCFTNAKPEEIAACEMPVPHDLEARLVDEMAGEKEVAGEKVGEGAAEAADAGETMVAFALLPGDG